MTEPGGSQVDPGTAHAGTLHGSRREAALEEELRRARAEVSLLTGQLGHDLRTPLTAILANAELLASEPAVTGDEDLAWMVDGITRGANRLNKMIEGMLDHAAHTAHASRAAHAAAPVARAGTDLAALVAAALDDLAPLVAETSAQVDVGPLPTVLADPSLLRSILVELLCNALTFTRPGVTPEVAVEAGRVGSGWRVSVRDNGVGIPAERLDNASSLSARPHQRVAGEGTGLARVRRLVEAHGGRVGIDSEVGVGTTVWFELPG